MNLCCFKWNTYFCQFRWMAWHYMLSWYLLGQIWLLYIRQEGPRDYVDMLKSLAVLPNVILCDIANMIVEDRRNRGLDAFGPHEGRVAEATNENIVQAENGELRVDWPWYPNGIHGQMAGKFST